eukprot:scaffold153088_cov19-Tisochrysis_lutea.AAC.1
MEVSPPPVLRISSGSAAYDSWHGGMPGQGYNTTPNTSFEPELLLLILTLQDVALPDDEIDGIGRPSWESTGDVRGTAGTGKSD